MAMPVKVLPSSEADRPPAAHAPLKEGSQWHSLEDHLRQVGALAASRIDRVIDPTWGKLAGIWHDLGKYAPDWQDFIRLAGEAAQDAHLEEDDSKAEGPRKRRRGPDHSTAGAIHATRTLGNHLGAPLAFAISGHHGGIPDKEDLRSRLNLDEKKLRHDASVGAIRTGSVTHTSDRPTLPPWLTDSRSRETPRAFELFIRMLFSALVDADFLDTEAYFAIAGHEYAWANARAREQNWPPLASYRGHLDRYLEEKARTVPASTVNRLRAEVLGACRAAAGGAPGIFSLTVPTGGGKTLASLAFAMDHAAKNGHRRVVIALPFTSIIEQTAEVLRSVFSALGTEVVLEHHSALDPTRATALGRVSSENWDAPLVVTTQVQLFESLFANRPGACRKLHSLIGSILILDEVQSLPSSLLEPILDVLDDLAEHYGVTVVLTTATQPALHRRELGGSIFRGLRNEPREIIVGELEQRLWDGLRRISVHWPRVEPPISKADPGAFWNTFGAEVASHDRVLAITHLKNDAQELWQAVSSRDSHALHLSAAMCPAHRAEVLKNVKRLLASGTTCRLVTTQVVEAGVDIDFPVVYRAMAGLESLAQSAGRCNREGRLAKGDFYVFEPPSKPPRSLRLHQEIARQMLDPDPGLDLSSPDTFRRYFDRLYSQQEHDGPGIQPSRLALNFRATAEKFRMIEQATTSVFVPYDENAKHLLAALRFAGPSRRALQLLQRYAVSVYQNQFDSLRSEGAVEEIGRDSGLWELCSDVHYHKYTGLRTAADPSVAMII